jgi:hypothetical protein
MRWFICILAALIGVQRQQSACAPAGRHRAEFWGGLMVTATQLSRLDAKLGALVAAIDTDSKPITVVVFQGEARERCCSEACAGSDKNGAARAHHAPPNRQGEERPVAIGQPFALLCQNNYLELNLFQADPSTNCAR